MDHASISKHDIARFMLSEDESTQAKELLEMLFDFQEVTKALQDPTLTLAGVRPDGRALQSRGERALVRTLWGDPASSTTG
ncbi:hypothetical protein PC111_g4837 [Phytophthora cactorum]|nr:hypothetical protein PC111_g4837 [Phytophthora cactorum]KAG3181634.1 hypothetical protein C6341_g6322 [Phytophthora cactorum]